METDTLWYIEAEDDQRSDLEKPLFEEVSEKHYREDAYGGPYGVLVGGMAQPTFPELAVQFMDAADELLARIRAMEVEDFTLANPILYLYRHSLEMLLKSRLESVPKKHDLAFLLKQFADETKKRHSCEVPAWIVARTNDINDIDRSSTAFRYGDPIPNGELHVYLGRLQTVVKALHSAINDAPRFRTDLPVFRGY